MIALDRFLDKYILPFQGLQYLYVEGKGFIVWRLGTGENIELLHIAAAEIRQGQGRWLVYRMLDKLQESPPYFSVYGFTRQSNTRAIEFYKALGFYCCPLTGLYAEGQAVLFWRGYRELLGERAEYGRLLSLKDGFY